MPRPLLSLAVILLAPALAVGAYVVLGFPWGWGIAVGLALAVFGLVGKEMSR